MPAVRIIFLFLHLYDVILRVHLYVALHTITVQINSTAGKIEITKYKSSLIW